VERAWGGWWVVVARCWVLREASVPLGWCGPLILMFLAGFFCEGVGLGGLLAERTGSGRGLLSECLLGLSHL
jgi:hypothetical protein